MSSPAMAGERFSRLLLGAGLRAREVVLAGLDELRPWLQREAWSWEHLAQTAARARRKPGRALKRGAGVLLLLGGGLLLLPGRDEASRWPHARVEAGPFRVAIVESGSLQALRSVTYSSQIQSNQAKIVAIAPEGKLVQKGDMLLLFDAAPFEEEIRKGEALLRQAQAELQKELQELKLQSIANREELASARQKLERSELELLDVSEGKGRLQEEEAAAALMSAERELQKALAAHADLKPLLAEGFITKLELERAEQLVAQKREELALAASRRTALLRYGRPRELSQARSDAALARESFRELDAAATYRLGQKRAGIEAAEARIQELEARLNLSRQQLARAEVRADVPGIVVYKQVSFGSEQRKPQVGDQVWANQPLLILPDISKMVVESRVRETDLHKVERNQKVRVRVEAYPELRLSGRVSLVGTLAQEEKERRGAKFFGVSIEISESEPRLRPGMTARVEIEVEARPRALFVPLDAVFERDGRHVAFALRARGFETRQLALGPSNQDFVIVEGGLREGERVALLDPRDPAPGDLATQAAP